MKQILINCEGLEHRVAVAEDGKLQEYQIERLDHEKLVGSIFKGKIRNLEASLQAAFVDVGAEKNAFLHYWDMLPASEDMLEDGKRTYYSDEELTVEKPREKTFWDKVVAFFKGKKKDEEANKKRRNDRRRNPRHKRGKRGNQRSKPSYTIEDIPDLFKVNSDVFVQVTKGSIGTKGARVTTNLSIPGRYLVLLPNSNHIGVSKRIDDGQERTRLRQIFHKMKLPKGMGMICRTAAAGKPEKCFHDDLELLLNIWKEVQDRDKSIPAPCCVYEEPSLIERTLRDYLTEDVDEVIVDSREIYTKLQEMVKRYSKQERVKVRHYTGSVPIFQRYHLARQIDNIFMRKVFLPSGAYLCVDETEAMITIDVNSGKSRGGKDHPETILNTNLEAVEEISRQLRLRNIGGLIVLDLIDMRSRKDRHTVYKAMKTFMQDDRARTKILPISDLGLIEMTRQREQESLRERLYDPCPYCKGRGLVKSSTSISVELQRRLREMLQRRRGETRFRVIVHPMVLERLRNEDSNHIMELEMQYKGALTFRADESMHVEQFKIVSDN